MGCISGSRDDALFTVESIPTSILPEIGPQTWYLGIVILIVVSLVLAFIRAKLPPTALEALARQIAEIDDVLRKGVIDNILDPQVVLDFKLIISR